jgi:hypothetical protein
MPAALSGGVEPPRAAFGGPPPDPLARAINWHPRVELNELANVRSVGTGSAGGGMASSTGFEPVFLG